MTQERWKQIQRLYHAALELPPGRRSAYLDEACAGDEEMGREVESLLASHDQAGSFIETPPGDVAAGMVAGEIARSMTGRTLGHYKLQSLLGAGGMGEVYRARDLRLDRDVAVKILPEQFAQDPEALRRFEREAKAVAALSHPNILSIFDFGAEAGRNYAVMELLEGETLRARLRGKTLDWREVAEIGSAITEGITAAHAKGIIHRDLKPENIFLTSDGQVKILDFGIARVKRLVSSDAETLTTEIKTTKHGAVMGTIGYMSPEQARGEAADTPSDIFSLGCVLYETLSGRRPFAGETATETIAAILRDEPPPFAASGKKAPEALQRVILHCLEKKPGERYQSARELGSDLKAALTSGSIAAPSNARRPARLARRPARLAALSGAALMICLLVAAAWVFLGSRRDLTIDSLAILPIVNASGDAGLEYLSDGITESLINNLSQLPQLKVMSRGTVFSYKDKEVDPRKVGQELNVGAVFTGKMIQRGDTLNIQADLADAGDGSQIWGDRYTRKLSDAQAVQEEIAKQISEWLRLKLSGAQQLRVTKRHTENPEAYQLYLKGRYYSNQFTTEGLKKGIECLNQAVELDPTYALALAGLSASYHDASNIIISPDEALPKVKAAALRALQLDETIAEAHTSLAQFYEKYEFDRAEAEKQYKRAMELNPNYARGYQWYGMYLAEEGRMNESIAAMARARDLDPLAPMISSTLAYLHYLARRPDEAITQLRKMISMDSKSFIPRYTLGLAYQQKGMHEQAIAEFNEAQRLDRESWAPVAFIAQTHAIWGKRDEARRGLDELMRIARKQHVDPYNIGVIHAGLAEKDQAFAWFEKAFQARSEELLFIKVDPRIDGLRSDARYADLLRRLKLAP